MLEYSTAVPMTAQVEATGSDTNAIGSFIASLGALVTPVAQVVGAAQAAKNQITTSTGDGQKGPAPTLQTSVPVSTGNQTLLYVGLGVAALVAVIVLTRSRR
jgi:hypothetical protein